MRVAGLLAALLAIGACGGEGDDDAARAAQPVTRDAQLLYTVAAGTEWIGAVGRDAQARASAPAARSYAATMAADHQGLGAAFERAGTQNVRAVESGVGETLIREAQTARTALQGMTGAEYDLVFVESAIRLQQRLLSAVERDVRVLQDPTLRQLAEQTRPTLEAHILRGRQLLPELRAAQAADVPTAPAASASTGGPPTIGRPVESPSAPPARSTPTQPDTTGLPQRER